ncbi:MAG: hypothetical protein AAF725_10025 [Acidobacteriota bacterium]
MSTALSTARKTSLLSAPLLRTRRLLPAAAALLLIAGSSWGQETQDPEPVDETPPAIVPPEGPEDSWGYSADERPSSGAERAATVDLEAAAARPRVERARLIGELGHRYVTGIRKLRPGIGRVEWSRQGDWMAYDKLGDRGVRGLYVGSVGAENERCLTCEQWDFRNANVLSPTWHPSGEYLVMTVQKVGKKLDLDTGKLASPARGLHGDLWTITREGADAWQMTQVVPQGGAIMDPVFSQEGGHLAWAERYSTKLGGRWGAWRLRIAEYKIKRRLPRLGNIETFELPWPAVAAVHGFTDDDKGLWLSIGAPAGREGGGFQPARLDLETGKIETFKTLGTHDDLMLGIPRSGRRVWASDRDLEAPRGAVLPRRSDLWFMSESGRRQERLTFFNEPTSPHSLGEAWISDLSWSPGGDRLLMQVLSKDPGSGGIREDLFVLDFAEELIRQEERR